MDACAFGLPLKYKTLKWMLVLLVPALLFYSLGWALVLLVCPSKPEVDACAFSFGDSEV